MKQTDKEPYQESPQSLPDQPAGEEMGSKIPGIRKCRGKVMANVSSLQNQRAQLVVQWESAFRQIREIQKQLDTLALLSYEANLLHHSKEVHAYQARINELESEVTKLAYRYGLLDQLIEQIDAELP